MLVATQPNALWRFDFDFSDEQGRDIGSISWPDVAVATNARLQGRYPDGWTKNVGIVCAGRPLKVEFEYLNRAWNQDLRFSLHDGDATIASVDCCRGKRFYQRSSMRVTEPFVGGIVRRNGLFAIRYDVVRDGQRIGCIYEKPRLEWKRKVFIDIDASIDAPVQFFLFFLVCNHAFN